MGIKHLWTILGPYHERKPLYELQGKTVAVDLSCWICEAQNIAEYQVQPRMYLRNLYFRTCYLLLMEVQPVFVLEGKAPELKHDTIAARNAIQFKGAKPKAEGATATGKGRTRFNFVLRQCEEMLGYLGLACITGKGEAECLCAYLNQEGLVDGCISQDSDCFAYGAQVVYRNFSISQQGANAASGGAVDVYDIRKVDKTLDLGRNKLVAMALLLGCDYTDGVHGVGKDSVIKFFENISDEECLERIRSWRRDEELFKGFEDKLNDKNVCSSCGHSGKVQGHSRNGCNSCGTHKGCGSGYKEPRLLMKNELNMRNKAIVDPEFPNEVLIAEFLTTKDRVSSLDLQWRRPNLVKFVQFAAKFLTWEELYAFEKFLPILTRWQVLNPDKEGVLTPHRIKKVRNPKGIPSFEIIWDDLKGGLKGVIPQEQLENQDLEKLWSTIEPQKLVERAYPDLVEAFRLSKVKPKKASKKRGKVDVLSDLLANTSISEVKPKKTKTLDSLEKSFGDLKIAPKTIDSYFKKAVLKDQCQSTPNKNLDFDLDMSNFGDEDDCDVSDIVDNIVKKKPNLLGLLEDKETCFFNMSANEDLFEKTFNLITNLEEEEEEDSFTTEYIPLHERIKNKHHF